MHTTAIHVDKIASAVYRLGLDREVTALTERRKAHDGDIVVVKARAEKRVYGQVELAEGRMAKIFRGDLIVGALGTRRALKGFAGMCPDEVGPGDELAVLNLGGVIGVPQVTQHPDLGVPCPVEFIGFVLDQRGEVATVASATITAEQPGPLPALVAVSGTCMASGKTRAACEIIHELQLSGKHVNGAKLTGVACRRDLLVMRDHGARRTSSFLDCGLVSTVGIDDIARYGRLILNHLATDRPELIVLELGDGLLGEYGVMDILKDLRDVLRVHVVCATDPVGAWGAAELLKREGIRMDLVSGPCTDNIVGTTFVETQLGLPALNACAAPQELCEAVVGILEKKP